MVTCFDCFYADLYSEYEVGIPLHMQNCKCIDVPEELLAHMFEKHIDPQKEWLLIEEDIMPKICGHFLYLRDNCDHKYDSMDWCFICGHRKENKQREGV